MSQVAERAETMLKETREELTRADAKATTLLAINGIFIAALLAAVLAGNFDATKLNNLVEWGFWLGSAALIAAEALLAAAILPNIRHPDGPSPPRYFGHVAQLTLAQLKSSLTIIEDTAERTLTELHVLSLVALRKYRLVIAGELSLAAGVILCAFAGFLG